MLWQNIPRREQEPNSQFARFLHFAIDRFEKFGQQFRLLSYHRPTWKGNDTRVVHLLHLLVLRFFSFVIGRWQDEEVFLVASFLGFFAYLTNCFRFRICWLFPSILSIPSAAQWIVWRFLTF